MLIPLAAIILGALFGLGCCRAFRRAFGMVMLGVVAAGVCDAQIVTGQEVPIAQEFRVAIRTRLEADISHVTMDLANYWPSSDSMRRQYVAAGALANGSLFKSAVMVNGMATYWVPVGLLAWNTGYPSMRLDPGSSQTLLVVFPVSYDSSRGLYRGTLQMVHMGRTKPVDPVWTAPESGSSTGLGVGVYSVIAGEAYRDIDVEVTADRTYVRLDYGEWLVGSFHSVRPPFTKPAGSFWIEAYGFVSSSWVDVDGTYRSATGIERLHFGSLPFEWEITDVSPYKIDPANSYGTLERWAFFNKNRSSQIGAWGFMQVPGAMGAPTTMPAAASQPSTQPATRPAGYWSRTAGELLFGPDGAISVAATQPATTQPTGAYGQGIEKVLAVFLIPPTDTAFFESMFYFLTIIGDDGTFSAGGKLNGVFTSNGLFSRAMAMMCLDQGVGEWCKAQWDALVACVGDFRLAAGGGIAGWSGLGRFWYWLRWLNTGALVLSMLAAMWTFLCWGLGIRGFEWVKWFLQWLPASDEFYETGETADMWVKGSDGYNTVWAKKSTKLLKKGPPQ